MQKKQMQSGYTRLTWVGHSPPGLLRESGLDADIKHRKQFNDKLAVDRFISKVSVCENQQKQQKEALLLF